MRANGMRFGPIARDWAEHGPRIRIRVGDYRIIYTIADDVLLIVIVTLGHRRDVYDH